VLAVELRKLGALWRVRAALLVVLVTPPLVALVLQLQQGLPTDTLYGRWVQDIGLAFPLVLLGSAGVWGIPVLASLVAGDVLSLEDAHGTWGTLLTRSRSRWQLFWGKAVVAGLAAVVLLLALAASAVLSGVLLVGTQGLVGLTGQPLGFGEGVALVLVAWLSTVPTALAVGCGALLVSAVTRSSLLGLAVPSLVAGALGLAGLLAPLGGVRPFLLVPGLTAWHGLLLEHRDVGPVLASVVVAVLYGGLLLAATVLVLRRRDWAVP
jgi:ABC-2 type transport system permease protein